MKSIDLSPTRENVIRTIIDNDLGRIEQVFYFAALLNEVEGPYSFAINARWGEGKTFFVKQTQAVIDAFNDESELLAAERESIVSSINKIIEKDKTEYEFQPQLTVYYDAWACDDDCDPILSLVYEIIKATSGELDSSREGTFKKVLQLGASVAEAVSGIGFRSIVDSLKDLIEKPDALEHIKKQRKLQETINEFLNSIHIEKGNRIVIFVDELDRCKPDFAVRFLERIKHYFTNEHVTFVFSVNRMELCHTIKRFYGTGFNADEYLVRFFDYTIDLPAADLNRYFKNVGIKDNRFYFELTCKAVIKHFRFSLRDLAKYYHQCRIAVYNPTHKEGYLFSDGIRYSLYNIVPIIIGTNISDSALYNDFISGNNPEPLTAILSSDNPYSQQFMEALLSYDETFDPNEKGMKVVTRKDKLEEYYYAVFMDDYRYASNPRTVGSLQFDESAKATLLQIANGLTGFADRT